MTATKITIFIICFAGLCYWIIMNFQTGRTKSKHGFNHLNLPIDQVIITTTGEVECVTIYDCDGYVLSINEPGNNRRTYNFMIGHGEYVLYVGYGWGLVANHTNGYNNNSIGIAFIGPYDEITPTEDQFKALQLLLDSGVDGGKLTADYKLYPQRAVIKTKKPGRNIINVIKDWEGYVEG